jgi:hypothetical protein
MLMMIEGMEKYELPEFVPGRMLCLYKNRQRLRDVYEYYKETLLDSVTEVACYLGEADDQYELITEDVDVAYVEVVTEKTAVQNDREYNETLANKEHILAHYKLGECYSNYNYLGESPEGKLYFRILG